MKRIHTLIAIATFIAASAVAAQEEGPTPQLTAGNGGGKTRAEVQAETSLWRRSGLAELQRGELSDIESPEYERRHAEFLRLVNSRTYVAEVQPSRDPAGK